MHYKIYTTSRPSSIKDDINLWVRLLAKSPGRDPITYEIIRKTPRTVQTVKGSDKVVRLSWDWFDQTFPVSDGETAIFHFTPHYRKKWGMPTHIAGTRNPLRKDRPQFWVCAEPGHMSDAYSDKLVGLNGKLFKISFLLRILLHEQAHHDEDADNLVGDYFKQNDVHMIDYEQTAIHLYPSRIKFETYGKLNDIRRVLIGMAKVLQVIKNSMKGTSNNSIYQTALKYLGVDASPSDVVDDAVGCVESVTEILQEKLDVPVIMGTYTFYDFLEQSPLFKRVTVPMPGNIVLSPTGMGNGSIRGHTGIVGMRGVIMSNDSYTGKWMANYTLDTWQERYAKQGGMPVLFYSLNQ